jgi:hypothetical protein
MYVAATSKRGYRAVIPVNLCATFLNDPLGIALKKRNYANRFGYIFIPTISGIGTSAPWRSVDVAEARNRPFGDQGRFVEWCVVLT